MHDQDIRNNSLIYFKLRKGSKYYSYDRYRRLGRVSRIRNMIIKTLIQSNFYLFSQFRPILPSICLFFLQFTSFLPILLPVTLIVLRLDLLYVIKCYGCIFFTFIILRMFLSFNCKTKILTINILFLLMVDKFNLLFRSVNSVSKFTNISIESFLGLLNFLHQICDFLIGKLLLIAGVFFLRSEEILF